MYRLKVWHFPYGVAKTDPRRRVLGFFATHPAEQSRTAGHSGLWGCGGLKRFVAVWLLTLALSHNAI